MSFAARMTTADDILQLFQEYSIEGCDGVLTAAPAMVGGGVKQVVGDAKKDLQHHKVAKTERIAFVELRKSTTRADQTAAESRDIDALKATKGADIDASDFPEIERRKGAIAAQYRQTESRRGKSTLKTILHAAPNASAVPCYYLPWNPTGGAVEIKIPDRGGGPASSTEPILFLTAALSGCSIYVKGPANKPTVFHCGTASNTTGATAEGFWNNVMSQLGQDVSQLAAVHNKDYMVPTRGLKQDLKDAIKREDETKKLLQKQHKDSLEVEEVKTWGAVFGIRRGQTWTFYMQENCTVTYHKIRKTSVLGRRVDAGQGSRVYSRPAFCREIFPTGGAKAQCFEHLRMLKV